jgi:hypothetical protein
VFVLVFLFLVLHRHVLNSLLLFFVHFDFALLQESLLFFKIFLFLSHELLLFLSFFLLEHAIALLSLLFFSKLILDKLFLFQLSFLENFLLSEGLFLLFTFKLFFPDFFCLFLLSFLFLNFSAFSLLLFMLLVHFFFVLFPNFLHFHFILDCLFNLFLLY